MKNNSITVGDVVRVSKDAPRMYDRGRIVPEETDCKVDSVEDDNAVITHGPFIFPIPAKYLIKVNGEAKNEPKYHKGDRVRFKNIDELKKVKWQSFHWMLSLFADKEATIIEVEPNGYYKVDIDPSVGGINDAMIECGVEQTSPSEPKKPSEEIKPGDKVLAMKTDMITPSCKADMFRRNVSLVTRIEDGMASLYVIDQYGDNHYARTAVEFLSKVKDETTVDKMARSASEIVENLHIASEERGKRDFWSTYTAQLAHDIAVKLANKNTTDFAEVGANAVKVAKAVVEELKKK